MLPQCPARFKIDGMSDDDCVVFLQWALPRLRMRWEGFRKPRRQVCRRIGRRLAELGLDAACYRAYLEAHPEEWPVLDRLCRVTISRFYRDRGVWAVLEELAPEAVWSAGCASGEEAYTAALVWPGARILATDSDRALLARAREACYTASSLKELPEELRRVGFDGRCVRAEVKRRVTVAEHDVREAPPDGPFDVVLCRNLVFTYFDEELQRDIAGRLLAALRPGGLLVVGAHERERALASQRDLRIASISSHLPIFERPGMPSFFASS